MSNTDVLRKTEAEILPDGFELDHVFELRLPDYQASAEVDGWNPETGEAIEICQSESLNDVPKPGQKRKMASDVLKLVFLMQQHIIQSGRVIVTSQEMYTWLHQSGSWLSAVCRTYGIKVDLHRHDRKSVRKRIRNTMSQARREMR